MIFQFYHLLPELTTLENAPRPAHDWREARGHIGETAANMSSERNSYLKWWDYRTRLKHKPREALWWRNAARGDCQGH